MQKLTFDTGLVQFKINGDAVLSFNPSDPNVYNRFYAAADKIQALEGEMVAKCKNEDSQNNLKVLSETDAAIKAILCEIFGPQNDFDAIFSGVNVMAVCTNGERVITNFFAAIKPEIEAGAQNFVHQKADAAKAAAALNREQRRALAQKK